MAANLRIQMDIMDTGAKDAAMLDFTGVLQPFGDENDLLGEVPEWPYYATLEEGRFVLDGSFVPLPDDLDSETWAVWGGQLSGNDCRLPAPMVLDWSFDSPRSCVGLTFLFDPAGDIAGDMLVQWYSATGVELARMRVTPSEWEWLLKKRVHGFSRLVVTIYSTDKPRHYLKLAGIEFGARRRFRGSEIIDARIIEQLDPTAAELPRSELEFSVFDASEEYALLNPGALSGGLSVRQRVKCWASLPGSSEVVPFGTYYITSWDNETEKRSRFMAADVLGLLEIRPFAGGVYNTTAAALAQELLDGFAYQLEESLAAEPVKGWLPAGNRRDALQQLAFMLGCVVDTSRDGAIKLYRAKERPNGTIGYSRKFNGSSGLQLKPLVTAVQVTGHRWEPGEESEKLFDGELSAGRHTISLNDPATDFSLRETGGTGAVIVCQHQNQVVVVLEKAGKVELWGTPYEYYTTLFELENPEAPTGAPENVVEVTGATLVPPEMAASVAQRLLDYHNRRFTQRLRARLGAEHLADTMQVDSLNGQSLRGLIESLEIDLTTGMLCDMELSGETVDILPWVYHCGELYAPSNAIF